MKTITANVNQELKTKLREIADQEMRSESSLIRKILYDYLNRQEENQL